MHEMVAQRLGALVSRIQFVERSFREAAWPEGLGQFNFVVTNQAVHELCHKRYALALHAQVKQLLMPRGGYLVCDHFFGESGMSNDQLYMSVAEQRQALLSAGYGSVEQVMLKGGLVLHHATYKGFHDETLSGEWKGHRSSPLSVQYRVIYRVIAADQTFQVVSVTAHDYRRP